MLACTAERGGSSAQPKNLPVNIVVGKGSVVTIMENPSVESSSWRIKLLSWKRC
jgi:hypothetical protein